MHPLSSVLVQALPSCLLLKLLGREGWALEPYQQATSFLVSKLLSDLLKYEIWVWHKNSDFYCVLFCGEFSENFDLEIFLMEYLSSQNSCFCRPNLPSFQVFFLLLYRFLAQFFVLGHFFICLLLFEAVLAGYLLFLITV
jgi:hypothetical protein